MGVIKSDNVKGNPLHSSETGEFVSKDDVGGAEQETNDDVGVFALENKPRLKISSQGIIDFLNSKKEQKNKIAEEFINNNKQYFDEDMQSYYENLTSEEKIKILKESPNGYNTLFLKFATNKEIEALLYAEGLTSKKQQLYQDFLLLDKQKENINKKIKQEINNFIDLNDNPIISGVWYYSVNLLEYEQKAAKDENGLSSIDKKRQYYNDIINDPDAELSKKASAFSFLKKLDDFEKIGEEYLEYKKEVQLKYLDYLQDIESKIAENKSQQKLFENNSEIILEANKYIEKFQDANSIYSQARKNKAIWFTSVSSNGNVANAAEQYFGPKFENMWNNLTSKEQEQLIDYTGGGYSKYNKPLRGMYHSGWSGFNFSDAVTNLTNAIDKCTWDEDIWLQRGISDSKIFLLPGSSEPSTILNLTEGQLQSLVGTSFKDNGFVSCGAGKGTGFDGTIIFNFYCPKGTKMAYLNTKGQFKHTSENEMLIQRGYDYRITKVEKKNGRYFLDCDVMLNSDKDKIIDKEKLKEIGEKYL